MQVGSSPEAQPAEERPHGIDAADHGVRRQERQHELRPRQDRGTDQQVHVAPQTAARDEHEALDALGELVRHLHRDAAAEGVADHGRAAVAERCEEVSDPARVGPQGVVAARLGRLPVPEQVGRHDRVALREGLDDLLPGERAARDAVDEDHDGAPAGLLVAHPVAMQDDFLVFHPSYTN